MFCGRVGIDANAGQFVLCGGQRTATSEKMTVICNRGENLPSIGLFFAQLSIVRF